MGTSESPMRLLCIALLGGFMLISATAMYWSCTDVISERNFADTQCGLRVESSTACAKWQQDRNALCDRYGASATPCKREGQLHALYCGTGAAGFRWTTR